MTGAFDGEFQISRGSDFFLRQLEFREEGGARQRLIFQPMDELS
jgi:hypothetical protein